MTNLEKAKDLYHKIGMEETMLSALCEMAEWKEQQMIEKAVKWIKSQMIPYGASPLAIFNYIEEFKQAMEEE